MRQISAAFGREFAAFGVERQIFCRFGRVCRVQGTFRANHAALAAF